jgi:hypothetical protein
MKDKTVHLNLKPSGGDLRFKKLKRMFPNVGKHELLDLIDVENEIPFSCNKWYTMLCAINKKNDARRF